MGTMFTQKFILKLMGGLNVRFQDKLKWLTGPEKRVPIPLEELIDESFEGSCILRLYHTYVGSTHSISLLVEEIFVTDRETSSSYFDDEED